MADQYVYIFDKEFQWVPAIVVEQGKDKATVSVAEYQDESEITGGRKDYTRKTKTVTVKLKDYPNKALPLQNVTDGEVKALPDMIELSFLHEAAILYNLKARHVKGTPYTRTGDIVVAVNPYQWFPSLYKEENRNKYSRSLVWEAGKKDYDPRKDLPPHVYETSALSYKGLSLAATNQSILVSGESGAGKTETVKICMNHLASVVQQEHLQDGDSSQDQTVITKVLDSNPLLESFGNAKTRRNDNSSRFGKYIQLQFERGHHNPSHLTLLGSQCQVYLLEKSRVVRHDHEERSFHIFYQLLGSSDDMKAPFWKILKGTDNSSFKYIGHTDTTVIEGVSDGEQFKRTIKSLAIIGIKGNLLTTLIQAICIVLQLGNLSFEPSPEDADHSIITSERELKDLATLMDIATGQLETTLTKRVVKVRKEETLVPLSKDAAKESADALAKQIYDRVFLWLVEHINKATTAGDDLDRFSTIGLLDIFGFESFPVNSFEQLCINYANEQLQQKFTQDVFVSVFEEYKEEGIGLDEIKYDDNTHVLDLIQNKTGLLAMLNEECIRPNGSDYGFVNKALHSNKASPALIIPRIVHSKLEFGIRHYAGDVLYDATDFCSKNMDTLPSDLLACAQTSSNQILKELDILPKSRDSKKKKHKTPTRKASNIVAPTAWSKYKGQLSHLMEDLHKTQSRYIRCVKPNSSKSPLIMEHALTLQQLRSSGVISAVTLARSAFPNRLENSLVLERFYPLWPSSKKRSRKKDSAGIKKDTETLMKHTLKHMEMNGKKAFVIGNSRTYFRAGALEYLESIRLKGMEQPAIKLQSIVRMFLAKRLLYKLLNKNEIEELEKRNRMAVIIQCAIRKHLAQKELGKRQEQHLKKRAKALKEQKQRKKLDFSAVSIQKIIRGRLIRKIYSKVLEKSREKIVLKEKIKKLEKKIAKVEKTKKKEREKASKEIDTATASRSAWEESVLAGSKEEVEQSEELMMVELLQGDHRQLQIRAKTLDGMMRPFKKNFEALMETNKKLREEFAEIHKQNETIKASNNKLIQKRIAAEKKMKELQGALNGSFSAFSPGNQSTRSIQSTRSNQIRSEYQRALKEIVDLLEARCTDTQLVEDAISMSLGGSRGALTSSPDPKSLGGSFSHMGAPKTPMSSINPTGSSSRRRAVHGSIAEISSPGLEPRQQPGRRSSFKTGVNKPK